MTDLTFGPLENFSRFDKLYDEPKFVIHRDDCPASPSYGNPHKFSTLCMCKELDKADKDGRDEDRADDERKYG